MNEKLIALGIAVILTAIMLKITDAAAGIIAWAASRLHRFLIRRLYPICHGTGFKSDEWACPNCNPGGEWRKAKKAGVKR